MNLSSKMLAPLLSIAFLFSACQKHVAVKEEITSVQMVASDALTPLPCHSIYFVTDYLQSPGKVPPFRFTKALYSDSRVKTINMLSRVYPKAPEYPNQAYETIGSFSYSVNAAKFVGTVQTWEYFTTSKGAAAKRSINKNNITIDFTFNNFGFCETAINSNGDHIKYTYNDGTQPLVAPVKLTSIATHAETRKPYEPDHTYDIVTDQYGNITAYNPGYKARSIINIAYDYSKAGGRYSYQPTQYGVSFEHNLVEVMQWIPPAMHERKTVAIQFHEHFNYDMESSTNPARTITQSQNYLNQKYDRDKNLISYTYSDHVLQKIGWFCK